MLGIKPRNMPIYVIHDRKEDKFALSTNLLNSTAIESWIDDWKNGKLERYYKSEDPYPNQERESLKNITADEFHPLINKWNKEGKDVVVCFYANFDGVSKDFLKILKEVSLEYPNSNIVYTQMDFRANELKEFKTQVYPVIHLYKRNKEMKPYKGLPDKKDQFLNYLSIYTDLKIKRKDL